MKKTIWVAAALAASLSSRVLYAGAQCRLLGTVSDSAGNGIEGASVLVTTPNLTTFKLTLKTDRKGQYSAILNDCTMPYHVKFEKEGYVSADADKKIPINDQGIVDMKLSKTSEAPGKSAPGAPAPAAPSASDQAVLAYNAGVEALNAGDKATAESKFLQAVGKNPDLPAGWQALTQLAYQKKDWAKTLEYGQKAVDLDPSASDLYAMLSQAARESGDKKGAAEWQAKYEEANPESPQTLYNKGIEAYNKGKMKDAETALSKAVEIKPDYANAHFWLGMAAFNQNKKASARDHLQKYLELDPSGKEAATAKEILPLLK